MDAGLISGNLSSQGMVTPDGAQDTVAAKLSSIAAVPVGQSTEPRIHTGQSVVVCYKRQIFGPFQIERDRTVQLVVGNVHKDFLFAGSVQQERAGDAPG